jgi:hypothetical protein
MVDLLQQQRIVWIADADEARAETGGMIHLPEDLRFIGYPHDPARPGGLHEPRQHVERGLCRTESIDEIAE